MTEVDNRIENILDEANEQLGGALSLIEAKDNVVGREREVIDLQMVLARRDTPVALLLAEAGVGKTALVSYLRYILEKREGRNHYIFQLEVGLLGQEGTNELAARLNQLLVIMKKMKDEIHKFDPDADVILFIDEVHTVVSIFGVGSKIGGDLLKTTLARAEEYVDIITATTPDEYNTYISGDKPLSRRFKTLMLPEVTPRQTVDILRNWLKQKSKAHEDLTKVVSDRILKRIVKANKTYREQFSEPAKSIDVLSSLIARHDITNEQIDDKLLGDVFRVQYNVDLNFDIDPNEAMAIIKKRVLGQPLALRAIETAIKRIAFRADDSRKQPRGTFMFAGTTGTGKTEMAKAMSEAIFGSEQSMIILSMTDYSHENADPEFRRDFGKRVTQNPSAVVLLDEIEKADERILNSLLPMLDEGNFHYSDVGVDGAKLRYTVSLKNSIIILTSNAGAKALSDINRLSRERYIGESADEDMVAGSRELNTKVEEALASTLKPEFLQRFQAIVPFVALNHNTLLRIANMQLEKLLKMIYVEKNVIVRLPPPRNFSRFGFKPEDGYSYTDESGNMRLFDEITMYIVLEAMASSSEANKNGARMIRKVIDSDIYPKIIDAYYEHRNDDVFYLRTNGKTRFETNEDAITKGAVIVKAHSETI